MQSLAREPPKNLAPLLRGGRGGERGTTNGSARVVLFPRGRSPRRC